MNALEVKQRRLLGILALLVAAALGFALARMTTKPARSGLDSRLGAAEQTASPAKLDVDGSHLAAVGIELEHVTPGNLGAEISAPASVSSAPDAQAVVTSHAAGTVVNIEKRLGDAVRAGETLARIESREAAAMAADRDVAVSKAALARSIMERERRLYE